MSDWLAEAQYLFANSSAYVQLALMGIQILVKFAPPLFKLISEGVDEVFKFIDAAKEISQPDRIPAIKKNGREELVQRALIEFPDIPETRIRSAIEDMVDIKKVIRQGKDMSFHKEAVAIAKGVIDVYEMEQIKSKYPLLFGGQR